MAMLIFVALCSLFYTTVDSSKISYNATDDKTDPDFYRNVSQLISSKGYPVEEYEVTTTDGYILGIQRIPHGRSMNFLKKARPVVFLQHGLLACGSDWMATESPSITSCSKVPSPDDLVGFILADAGYDVWIGNQRGSTYSRKHVNYTVDDSEFWKFSFDEMAKYDLPVMIELALDKTNQKQLYYVGHSEGTTVAFALLSEKPDYKPIRAVMALGPVATVGFITSPLRYFAPFVNELQFLLDIFGVDEFLPNTAVNRIFAKIMCKSWTDIICENVFFLISGFDLAQLNKTRLAVYGAHYPSGTSTQNVVHFGQMVNSRKFQKYDFGLIQNYEKYGQVSPPEYKIENIKTPIALFSGLNDVLADPADVDLLKPRIKNLIESYVVKYPLWGHADFLFGMDAPKYVYKELLRVMSSV